MDKTLETGHDDWGRVIHDLQQQLSVIQPELVTAEALLTDQIAQISAFEFKVRSHLEPLTRRLDRLEGEIQELQKQLRRLQDSWLFADTPEGDDLLRAWHSSEDAGAAAGDEYRYHSAPDGPPPAPVSGKKAAALKNLYRGLARRFHPDFALNEEDRAYRTGLMMAINAAYTAGDMEKLEELAREPDPQRPYYSPEEMALALLRELDRCQKRLAEIEVDLERLARHPSALLKKRADRAAKKGRDLFEELAAELRDRVAERMVQRDVLLSEIDGFENGNPDFVDDALADAVFNFGLEQALMEDGDIGAAEWRDRHRNQLDWSDDDEDDAWEALRRARDSGSKKA
jgi:DNA repair exonuclease SbcCD ATPase subunit